MRACVRACVCLSVCASVCVCYFLRERERERRAKVENYCSVNCKRRTLRKYTKKTRRKIRAGLTVFHDLALPLTRCPSGLRCFPITVAYVSLVFVLHSPIGERRVDVCIVLLFVVAAVVVVWGGELSRYSMAWCGRMR